MTQFGILKREREKKSNKQITKYKPKKYTKGGKNKRSYISNMDDENVGRRHYHTDIADITDNTATATTTTTTNKTAQ